MKGNQEGRAAVTTAHRNVRLAVLFVAAALTLAACSGGSSTPQVASLNTSPGTSTGTGVGATSTTQPTGNPAQLLNKWAACMRKHGDPSQADPTIDANKVIHVVMLPSVPGGLMGSNGQSGSGPGVYCSTYLTAAQAALQVGQPVHQASSQAQLLKYSECMRANGIPDFPDPGAGGLQIHGTPGSDLDPGNPVFQNAGKVCARKTGVYAPAAGGPLPAGTIMEGTPGGPQEPALITVQVGNG
jgi:hypothetical protein